MLSSERAAQHVRIRVPSSPDDLCRTKFNELFFNCWIAFDAFTYLSIPLPGTCLWDTGTAGRWWPLLPPEPRHRPASEARWKYCAGASAKKCKKIQRLPRKIFKNVVNLPCGDGPGDDKVVEVKTELRGKQINYFLKMANCCGLWN